MKQIIIFIIITFFFGCTSLKPRLYKIGGQNEAVYNVVQDFLYTSKLSKKDTVFDILIEDLNKEILGISIIALNDKIQPTPANKIGSNIKYFPTRYIEQENKLFLWYDSTSYLNDELVKKLSTYNRIDSINVNGIVEIKGSIDDSKKAIDYYICKKNILIYKKVITRTAMGWYDPPNINCY
jgi:hypothetical protein